MNQTYIIFSRASIGPGMDVSKVFLPMPHTVCSVSMATQSNSRPDPEATTAVLCRKLWRSTDQAKTDREGS